MFEEQYIHYAESPIKQPGGDSGQIPKWNQKAYVNFTAS